MRVHRLLSHPVQCPGITPCTLTILRRSSHILTKLPTNPVRSVLSTSRSPPRASQGQGRNQMEFPAQPAPGKTLLPVLPTLWTVRAGFQLWLQSELTPVPGSQHPRDHCSCDLEYAARTPTPHISLAPRCHPRPPQLVPDHHSHLLANLQPHFWSFIHSMNIYVFREALRP